eukprot:g15751.t1
MSAKGSGGNKGEAVGGPPPRTLFKLQGSSILAISGGDLTKWKGDAIVNAANERMLGGGGVDGAIHRAAGRELLKACYAVEPVSHSRGIRCPTGEARITPGFRLDAKFVIHTVGPVYEGKEQSAPLLRNAIKNSLLLCKKHGLKSVAFPAISCGVYGYPASEAAEIAIDTMLEFSEGIDLIEFVLFGKDTHTPFFATASEKLEAVAEADVDASPAEPGAKPESETNEDKEAKCQDTQEPATEPSPPASETADATPVLDGNEKPNASQSVAPAEETAEAQRACAAGVEPMSQEESLVGLDGLVEDGARGHEPISQEETPGEFEAEPMSQSGPEHLEEAEVVASAETTADVPVSAEDDVLDRKRSVEQTAAVAPGDGNQGVGVTMETNERTEDGEKAAGEGPEEVERAVVPGKCDSSDPSSGR